MSYSFSIKARSLSILGDTEILASRGSLRNMMLGLQSCIAVQLSDMSTEAILSSSSSSLEATEFEKALSYSHSHETARNTVPP